METGVWEVNAREVSLWGIRVHGLLAGADYDLTLEPEQKNAVRQIAIKDKLWLSFDGNKTWKLLPASAHATFQRVYALVHKPISYESALPSCELVGKEIHHGEAWLHIKCSEKNQTESARDYWIAPDQSGPLKGVHRYEGPVVEPGHEKEPLQLVASYHPASGDAAIKSPPESATTVVEDPKAKAAPVSLLDGKLKIDVPADFSREPEDPENPKTLAARKMTNSQHAYEVRPRKDHRGVDLVSDALPFGRLWYGERNAVSNGVDYAKFYSRSHDVVIRVYDDAGNVIQTYGHAGDFKDS